MLPNSKPEHFRRSLRLAVGVFVPCFLGFAILGPRHVAHTAAVKSACKWMAITGAIVTHPLIGRASAIGSEQIVGTACGGGLGYLLHRVGQEFLGEAEDGFFLASIAALLAGFSVSLGVKRVSLTNIFIVTVLLSAFPVDTGQEQKMQYYGIARICGILLGVLMTLFLSVVLFPKSATVESLHDMDEALKYLCHLHACVWKPCGFLDADDDIHDGDDLEASLLSSRRVTHREVHHSHMEDSVTQLYGHLFDMEKHLEVSRSELLLWCTSNNHLIIVPNVFVWCGSARGVSSPLPIQSLHEMANSVRRVSRGFFTIEQALNDWFEVLGEEKMSRQAESGVLKSITLAMRDALFEIRSKFPLDRNLNPLLLLELIRVVKEWESKGQLTSLESLQKYREFSNTLDGLERQASLVLRDTFDASLLEDSDSGTSIDEDQSCRPRFGAEREYSQELLSFSFALKCLAVDVGILWNACEDVMTKLPFTS
mmetsp:Transcript_5169/g.10236  ORF Transcript_5169/g.10236 Transcript_5169/m.10236 type:complete len:482 (-) Transcript_5169:2107-3552(-)